MGAIDILMWGSMSPNPDSTSQAFQVQHKGDGPGSYRATIEEVKALLDVYADVLERLHVPPAATTGPAPEAPAS